MRDPGWPSSCVTPAGTSNELDVQNKWEENTYTHNTRERRHDFANQRLGGYRFAPLYLNSKIWRANQHALVAY